MDNPIIKIFPKHACQLCGCESKLIETIIDDEFRWNETEQMYQPNGFTDMYEHTGNNRCAQCEKDWTGL